MKKIFLYSTILLFLLMGLAILILFPFKQDTQKKLTFWSIQLKPIYEKEINKIINDFEKKHPDYKVIWVDIPIQEAQKRTLASILSSNPPDLINLNPDFSVILAQRNALYTFNEKDTTQFHPNLLNKLKYNNKIYAIPFYATSSTTIYNKEIYNKCQKGEFITSYNDLYKISKDLKACSGISPFASSLNEGDTLAKILNKYNIKSLENQKEIDATTKIYSMFNDMYKNNLLPKDILTVNHREVIEKYMSNQALIIVAGSNFINMIKQNAPDIYSKSAISEQLAGENKKYDISLMNLIIPKKSKNKDIALEFALLLTNEKNQLKLSKLTNVIPANKYSLQNEYFKNCTEDPVEQSRCISAKQLDNLNDKDFPDKNKKALNEAINKTLEEILLSENISENQIKEKIKLLSKTIKNLQDN